ncbi:serine/threonine-protein kinase PINK1, mitochondrial-like [Acipenser ruthenus]|uniref:serine/threonine-protein kinase PINK1, mitochondrial-like n=1 Tax=Acipenser ruthenus TaxID=7906 RepID=UPI00156102E6|nr:serine/threonine-protein kinase PINK1, mitochondrial-like [Acipenser ruthenus]
MSVKHAIGRGLELGRSVLQLGLLKPAARVAAKFRGERLRLGQPSSRVQPQTFLPGRYRYYRVSLSGLAAQLHRRVFWRIPGSGAPRNRAVFLAFGMGLGLIEQQLEEDRKVAATCQDIQALFHSKAKKHESPLKSFTTGYKLEDYWIGQQIGKGCNAAVYEAAAPFAAPWKPKQASHVQSPPRGEAFLDTSLPLTNHPARLPLAVKMMWNIGAGSSSESILRAMGQELVPAPLLAMNSERGTAALNGQFGCIRKKLEPHPNVIQVFRAFTADVPLLPGALADYPDVLPARINPAGIGHNRTLFLVMKNYPCTLRQSLQVSPPDNREAILLILQLLEGVDHLNRQGIAHRDLKSDNILLERDSVGRPRLVITDFGCCLAEQHLWLKLPFNSYCVDRGGNACLMAPEVASAVPGPGVVIDYSKADVWAVGAIAYEIFGLPNPFCTPGPEVLESRTYQEKQLPPLPSTVPPEARLVVKLLLRRNANKRPSARVAANLLHICHWVGNLQNVDRMKMQKIADWLLCRSAAALLHAGYNAGNMVEAELQRNFLINVDLGELRMAMAFLSCEWPWLF